MKPHKIKDILPLLEGRLISGDGEDTVSRVSKDSREVDGDTLFFALVGNRHDAHSFLMGAAAKGCRNFVVSRTDFPGFPAQSESNFILVENTTKALVDLGAAVLRSMDTTTIAITGSVGKTTTKDMVDAVLKRKYKTGRTHGNLNTAIGIAMCVLEFDGDEEVAVLEMGTDHPGEILESVTAFPPQIGIITHIGQSHLASFGTREGIFRGKMELTTFFGPDHTLIIQSGPDFLQKGKIKLPGPVLSAGGSREDDCMITDIKTLENGKTAFCAQVGTEKAECVIPVLGTHNAMNAGLAVLCGGVLGISVAQAAESLGALKLTSGRTELFQGAGGRKITVIDDTYNASPDSMKAGIDSLMGQPGARHIAILGDMLELGDKEEAFHREVGRYAASKGVDLVIGVGALALFLAEEAAPNGRHFATKKQLMESLDEIIKPGDVLLIKASRGMELDEIAGRLTGVKENV